MRVANISVLASLVFMLLSGCSGGPRADLPVNPASFAAPEPEQISGEVAEDYRFSAFDKMKVIVYQVPDLSSEYRIEPSGIVTFPLIGTIKVSGMTSSQLGLELERQYGARYLRQPDISVQLIEATGSEVTVEGSVKSPVVFTTFGETTLLQSIARASGLDNNANAEQIVVFRKIDGQTNAAAFDLKQIRAGLVPNPTIYGGDIIVVDGSGLKQAYREVLQALPLLALFRPF